MNRLLVTNGAFTTLLLSAVLAEQEEHSNKSNNYLVYYFKTLTTEKITYQLNFANFFFNYKKHFNLLAYQKKFSFNLTLLKNQLPDIQEIYLPINSTTKKWYKLLYKIYPKANFIFYEEGLMSYIKGLYDGSLKALLKKHSAYYLFYSSTIQKLFPKEFQAISKQSLLHNIQRYQEHHTILKNNYSVSYKYALVLPQYYFQHDKTKRQKLEDLYIYHIKLLIKNGYHILFKDHPKSNQSYYPILQKTCGEKNFTLLNEIDNLPIEIIGNLIKISLVFSVYSTSLFTLPYLFNIPAVTSYAMLSQRMNTFSLYPALIAEFTHQHIPDLESNNLKYNKLLYLYRKVLTFIYKIF